MAAGTIELRFFATLAPYQPPEADAFPLEEGDTVGRVVRRCGPPMEDVNIVFVNGRRTPLSAPLSPGDRVGVFPKVGGG